MSLSETNDAVFGPALTPNATYTKILAYRKAQGLPVPGVSGGTLSPSLRSFQMTLHQRLDLILFTLLLS